MNVIDDSHSEAFLRSALTEFNPYNTTDEVLSWIRKQNERIEVSVTQAPFSSMPDWYFDEEGNLRHRSGKFFSIEGLSVYTNYGKVAHWQQPIINQPEIGYLGIITKELNGILYFLLQAKVEPGNINNVQLSPTLQATKSNYTQVHHGNKPLYLDYFVNARKDQILLDQLQSEQGARFYKKRNRNIIIRLDEEIEVYDNFIWLTLAQIKHLSHFDNVVNMDTRTVISGIPYSGIEGVTSSSFGLSLLAGHEPLNSVTDILSWITSLKCKYELSVQRMPLEKVEKWIRTDDAILHEDGKYFSVIAAQISINNREVKQWSQPLIKSQQEGIAAFIVKKIGTTWHFLVQGKVELGNFDVLEMAPTVQCVTDSYAGANDLPFLNYVLNVPADQVVVDTMQSEEGGRFYHEQNRNMIIRADDGFDAFALPENYIWITLDQLMMFLHFNNYLNIQARSLISLIPFI